MVHRQAKGAAGLEFAESEIAVSVVPWAVIVGFAGSLLLIRVIDRLNTAPAPAPAPAVGVLAVRPPNPARQHAMMDR